jgi:hypothetical protein
MSRPDTENATVPFAPTGHEIGVDSYGLHHGLVYDDPSGHRIGNAVFESLQRSLANSMVHNSLSFHRAPRGGWGSGQVSATGTQFPF